MTEGSLCLGNETSTCSKVDTTPESRSSAEAVERIESMVLSFLTQLSRPAVPPSNEAEDFDDNGLEDRKQTSDVKYRTNKIKIQLAGRKKLLVDG